MLFSLSLKKLCPLMCLAMAFGCGKKINDPTTSDSGRTTQGQGTEMNPVLTMQINEANSSVATYTLPYMGWSNLPTKLYAVQGNAAGKKVKIYYNLLSNGDYDFYCNYKSTTSATELAFEKCLTSQGADFISATDDLDNLDIPLDKNSTIKMQLTNSSGSSLKIEATYKMDWKEE